MEPLSTGRRTMLLNAREVVSRRNARKFILLTIEDVTGRRATEREMTELLRQKEMLLHEMKHRVADHREHPSPQSSNSAVGGDAETP